MKIIEYHTAILAKEKGYPQDLQKCGYNEKGILGTRTGEDGDSIYYTDGTHEWDFNYEIKLLESPTQDDLKNWLMQTHSLFVMAVPFKGNWYYNYISLKNIDSNWLSDPELQNYDSYESAFESGLITCLKLIL